MPLQAGYCNGRNQKLGALEYHKGSEIDVAVNEFVLLLGDIRNIHNNQFSTLNVKAFYVPKGTACELYGTTLHFSPCRVTDDGFKSIIILPKGTNLPLSNTSVPKCDEDKLLWMQNKWLIVHADSQHANLGAHVGIIGENIEVNYK